MSDLPVSDSPQCPVDPLVQRIYDAIRELDVDQATPADDIIDAIEGAFEANGTPTNVLTCAFCGQPYPAGTPAAKHQALTNHIMQCESHPLRAVIQERDEARRAARRLYDLWPVEFFSTLSGIVAQFPWIERGD